jgi:hypothetical protein
MTILRLKDLAIATIIFFTTAVSAQSSEIKIKFIGNCGMYLTDGKQNIYLDFPYKSGAFNYMKYAKNEVDSIKENAIFIFTHRHADHYSRRLLRKLSGQKFDPFTISQLEKLNSSLPEFKITAFKTLHKVYGISFKHYSYLITWHGKVIYFSGDTGDLDDLKNIKNIDVAFVNPWLYMKAMREKVKIDAKKFGLYHLYPHQKIDGEIPGYLMILKNQGEIISMPY